jgi:hypothetical protein
MSLRKTLTLVLALAAAGCLRNPDFCGVKEYLGRDLKTFLQARGLKPDQTAPEGDGFVYRFRVTRMKEVPLATGGAPPMASPTPAVNPVILNPRVAGAVSPQAGQAAPGALPGDPVRWVPEIEERTLLVRTDARGLIRSYAYGK